MTARVILIGIVLTVLSIRADAMTHTSMGLDTTSTTLSKAKSMLMRLDILNATDQSNFTKSEKRIVRKEVKAIKSDLKELRGARYMRTGIIVLILAIPLSAFYITE